jgi:hypothetical protein
MAEEARRSLLQQFELRDGTSGVQQRPAESEAEAYLGLRCQAVRERDFTLLGDRLVGASGDGVVLECEQAVRLGDRVLVSIRLPSTGAWIDAEATVTDFTVPSTSPEPGEPSGYVALELGRIDGSSESVLELLEVLERAESVF